MSQRVLVVVGIVTALYFALNLIFMSQLHTRDSVAEADWQTTLHHARHRDRTTAVVGSVPKYGTTPPVVRQQPTPPVVAQHHPQGTQNGAKGVDAGGDGGIEEVPRLLPAPGPVNLEQRSHASHPPAVSSAPASPQAVDDTNAGVGKRPLLLYRTRFREPSGFSQEAIDFVRGLSRHYYVGLQMEGNTIDGYVASWSPELRAMIDRYHAREGYILARPHTLIHHGAAGDFFCDDKPERPMFCIGRAMFETDRVPFGWVDNLQTQHQIWVPSQFNVYTFARSGLDPAKLMVVPEPMNVTLFDPDTTTPLRLNTGKSYHFLAVYAWNDRKGWDLLLRAYWEEFSKDDDVCLVLRTFPKHKNDANFDPEASGEWVHMKLRGAAHTWFTKGAEDMACVHVLATHISERDLPRLYKAADAFVLPSRGEGWGRPMVEAMSMGMPTVITDWGAPTDYANTSNAWPIPAAGLSCVNSEPRRGNPAGVYAAHRWAEASIPELRRTLRILFTNTDPQIAQRAAAARATMRGYGYEQINRICESRLELCATRVTDVTRINAASVPEKYRVDPHGRLRDFYEDFMQRPPTDEEIRWADTNHRGWQDGGHVWQSLLCGLCTRHEFLVQWNTETMATCGECGAPLTDALAPYISDLQVCTDQGVDLVYTFATDNDEQWAAERSHWWTSLSFFDRSSIDTADAAATARARGSLVEVLMRMSLRSVALNARWVRSIFVVTDSPPAWLVTGATGTNGFEVTVVPTSAIMPAEHLPTFNSHAVEANLHKISHLSECYVYMNADYFFGRPSSLSDFVDVTKGQYKVMLEMDRVSAAASQLTRPPAAHDAAFRNANILLDEWAITNNAKRPERHFIPHAPHFMRKSLVEQLAVKASSQFQATSSHRFRSFDDLHVAYLHAYYLLEQPDKFLAKPIQTTEGSPMPEKPTYTVYLFNGARQPTSFYAELDVLRQAAQAGGAERMPRFFSINDAMDDPGSDHIVAFVRDSLLAIFPLQSEFESDSASLGLNLPDPSPTKQCPEDFLSSRTGAGGQHCPLEYPSSEGICTASQGNVAAFCEYTVDSRPAACRCCYPARLTWECHYTDGLGNEAGAGGDALVDPATYYHKIAWRGRSNSGLDVEAPTVWSGELQTDRAAFENAWGRCQTAGAIDVLVAVPYDDLVPCPVREKMFEALARLECGSGSKFNLHLGLVDDWEPTLPEDLGRRAAIARLRNHLLDKFLEPEHEYVLWLDGGVVEYPDDLVAKLHSVNPDGITAPLVLVEGSDSMHYHQRFCGAVNCGGSFVSARSHKLHDPRGFFVAGRPVGTDAANPANANEWSPYLGETTGNPVVECESVGVSYLAPADIYRQPTDKVPRYFATPLTEHYPVIHAAKYELGMRVVTDTSVRAFQAFLPRWGTQLEGYNPPFDDARNEWQQWLKPYLGKRLDAPELRRTPLAPVP